MAPPQVAAQAPFPSKVLEETFREGFTYGIDGGAVLGSPEGREPAGGGGAGGDRLVWGLRRNCLAESRSSGK